MVKDILEIVKELLEMVNIFKKRKISSEITKVVKIYDLMNHVLTESDVERFVIFKAHNGGGIIKIGSDLYASCVYEDYRSPFKSIKDVYQNVSLDKEYVKTLLEIINNKSTTIITSEQPDSLLKTIYEASGVKKAKLFFLHQDKKYAYYCSVATSNENADFESAKARLTIDLTVDKIKQIFTR